MTQTPHWLHDVALRQFLSATRTAGGEARIVGGAVRDFLLGIDGGDIDMASSLSPEQTINIAAEQGWKSIPTGLVHGTVTLVLPSRVIEVTTLRRDVATDGRHAVVAFTDCFQEDAARRDFTINALSMNAEGVIYDYFDGQRDLAARRIRFIGDPATRIKEDGLRILRYFRFLATLGTPPAERSALEACAQYKSMIAQLSGERIAAEMQKLLQAADPAYALQQMSDIGLAPYLTHHEWARHALFVWHFPISEEVGPWVRLMILVPPAERRLYAQWIAERWKLSRAQRDLLAYLAQQTDAVTTKMVKEWLRHASHAWVDARLQLAIWDGALIEDMDIVLDVLHYWPIPDFPLTAEDLLARGYKQGKVLGDQLRRLEQQWVASEYRLTKEALLAGLT